MLSLRKSESNHYEAGLLFEPFDTIIQIILRSSNPISVVKASVCLKSYFLYTYNVITQKGLMSKVFPVLDRLLMPNEQEIIS